jgi:hypothetical protein
VLHLNFAREAAGAAGTRLSLRPLFLSGERIVHRFGRFAPRECAGVFDNHEPAILSHVIARLDRATQYSREADD